MLYALLAYHEEHVIQAMDAAEDSALMAELNAVHGRWTEAGTLGPAARLPLVRLRLCLQSLAFLRQRRHRLRCRVHLLTARVDRRGVRRLAGG